MDNKKIRNLEIAGIFFTYLLGTFLRYSCQIFNWEIWTILCGAVNESAWETTKCFTLPYLIWAAIEFCLIKMPIKKFIVSKTAGIYTIISLFVVEFSLAQAVSEWTPGLLNIFTCLIWVSLGFYISYKTSVYRHVLDDLLVFCVFMMILFFSMYLSFTINPPHINFFRDNIMQIYGIPMCPVC